MITLPSSTITDYSEKLTPRESVDIRFREAEILERESRSRYDDSIALVKKIEVLENILSAHRPGEKENPMISEVNWEPVIKEEKYLDIIKKKLIELVNKL